LTAKRSNKTSLVMGGAVGLTAILFHSWWDFNMHIPANAILAVTLLALVSGHFRFATEKYWHTVRLPLKVATTVVLGSGLVFLLPQNIQAGRELAALGRAHHAKPQSDERLQALQQAFAVDHRNPKTAYEIGEIYRLRSSVGAEGHEALARTAVVWLDRAIRLNPLDAKPWVRRGMSQHWIGQRAEADRSFQTALGLDPHGYYTLAHMGWHYVQMEDFPGPGAGSKKSLQLNSTDNSLARKYLDILREREGSTAPPP
jgi:tetratricopeptide (TPR) repeat protein